eukprot:6577025-Prymnesium_polylepis.1
MPAPLADVEGLDKEKLNVAVWSGNVTLTDVVLRREACYALGLPVNVKAGSIATISATIPWSKLGSEPVSITLDGVYLVAGPLDEGNLDDHARQQWAWARKLQRLDAYLPGVLQQLAKGERPCRTEVPLPCCRVTRDASPLRR